MRLRLALHLLCGGLGLMADSSRVALPQGAHWQQGLPSLTGSLVVVREVERRDAVSLHEALFVPEVVAASHLIAPVGPGAEAFSRFIDAAHLDRAAGHRLCFGIVPRGCDIAIGVVDVRAMETGFHRAEWRAAIAPEFWGSGVFRDSATLVLDFLFGTVGARRVEARASVANERASSALMKIGAIREAVLRAPSSRSGPNADQVLWTILADDWQTDPMPAIH
jgi:RimJ/RimL family protein N-acetyltransferase